MRLHIISIHFGANSCVCACVCSCVCGSAHGSGCVVDGRSAMADIYYYSCIYTLVSLTSPGFEFQLDPNNSAPFAYLTVISQNYFIKVI